MIKIDIIIGMNYGGEGKGTLSAIMPNIQYKNYDWLIATSTPQSGHTCYYNNKKIALHHIPCAVLSNKNKNVYIPVGTVINLDTLYNDLKILKGVGIKPNVSINKYITVIRKENISEEKKLSMMSRIGSTQSGTGSALSNRIMRNANQILNNEDILKLSSNNIKVVAREDIDLNGDILIEASQGILLSNYGYNYPYATSLPVCPMSTLAKCQLHADELNVYGMARYYPIRVGGNSGGMFKEISWEDINVPPEMTTVTKRNRRVANLNVNELIKQSNIYGIKNIIINYVNYKYPNIDIKDFRDINKSEELGHNKNITELLNDSIIDKLLSHFEKVYVMFSKYGDMVSIRRKVKAVYVLSTLNKHKSKTTDLIKLEHDIKAYRINNNLTCDITNSRI